MKLISLLYTGVLTGLFSLGLTVNSDAQLSFTYTSFDPPGTISWAQDINDAGTIVGGLLDSDGITYDGYIDQGGTFTHVSYPGAATGSETQLTSINNAGVITGKYFDPNNNETDFIDNHGVFSSPMHPGATYTVFNLINDAGLVATVWYDSSGIAHSTVYDTNTQTFTDLPDGSSYGTYIQAIGPNGYSVANLANASGGVDGSIYNNGTYTIDDVPGADETHLDDINASGLIAGRYVENGLSNGLALYDGTFYTLDYPGATETFLFSVNNSNEMVGWYSDASGNYHSLLVQATPEPGNLALLAGGLMSGAGFLLRRRNTRTIKLSQASRKR